MGTNECYDKSAISNYMGQYTEDECITWSSTSNTKYPWSTYKSKFGDDSSGNHAYCRLGSFLRFFTSHAQNYDLGLPIYTQTTP